MQVIAFHGPVKHISWLHPFVSENHEDTVDIRLWFSDCRFRNGRLDFRRMRCLICYVMHSKRISGGHIR